MQLDTIKYKISSLIKRAGIFFQALEEREKLILILGSYGIVIIIGIFFITDMNLKKLKKLDEKLDKEISNYLELKEIASEYIALKGTPSAKEVSLKYIEQLTRQAGIRDKIKYIKPYEDGIEIQLENLTSKQLINFLKTLKKNELNISKLSIEKLKEDNIKMRLTITK